MKFSIIIPAYNAEKTITKAIESILQQDFKDYEIIVINDKSKDNTAKVAEKYNVKLIHNKHQLKPGGSRNVGIENATGEYIIFLDADDYLYEIDTLSKIDKMIGKQKIDILYMGFIMNVDGNLENKNIPGIEQEDKMLRLEHWQYPNVWDICWSRKFLLNNKIKFIEKRYIAEDALFYYEGVIKAKTTKVLPEVTHVYRVDSKSMSATTDITFEKMSDFYYMISKTYNFADKQAKVYRNILLKKIRSEIDYADKLATSLEKSQK